MVLVFAFYGHSKKPKHVPSWLVGYDSCQGHVASGGKGTPGQDLVMEAAFVFLGRQKSKSNTRAQGLCLCFA